MKLIREEIEKVEVITEGKGDNAKLYIKGPFLQAECVNRNGRLYPLSIMEREVKRYTESYVNKGRALGELGHPDGPTVNLERVSHIIKELKQDGNNITGKAKILDTPYGKIVKNLIDEGVKIGVSSRGMGSLKSVNGINEVQKDFMLSAVDIVADPSAPNAFVEGIMEGKEWVWDNGVLQPRHIESYRDRIERASTKVDRQEAKLYAFADFLSKLI